MKKIPLILLLAGFVLSNTVQAQFQKGRLNLTPHIGVLIPTNDVVESGALQSGSEAAAHEINLLIGGKLGYWFADDLALELVGIFAPNAIESDAFGIAGKTDTEFLALNLRLLWASGSPDDVRILLGGGLGFFATRYDDPLDMTTGGLGILSAGVAIPLGLIGLRMEIEDYITTTRWERTDESFTDRKWQNDLGLTLGLTIGL